MAIVLFSLSSCGGNEKSESEKATDTTAAVTPAPSEPAPVSMISTTPLNFMVATHKVKNFASWKASYDAHDSLRLANGAHSYALGRGDKDSNMVMVAVALDDVTKGKAFAKSPSLKMAMQKSGVMGAPTVRFVTLVYRDSSDMGTDLRSSTSITVKDWDRWQHSFDSTMKVPTDNGLKIRAYGHDADDSHKVVIISAITDTAKAHAYWKSDMLKQRRAASGAGEPVRFIYHLVKRY